MRPLQHVAISAVTSAGFFYFFQNIGYTIVAFITGVFLDIDHFFDYFHIAGFRFSLKEFRLSEYCISAKQVFLFFHSYELLIPIALYGYLSGNYLLAAALGTGLLVHLLSDNLWNPVTRPAYFLLYRLYHRFSADSFFRHDYKTVIYRLDPAKHHRIERPDTKTGTNGY